MTFWLAMYGALATGFVVGFIFCCVLHFASDRVAVDL